MAALDSAVANIQDFESLSSTLSSLGLSHKSKGVLQDHYPIVGQAIEQTLQDGLGHAFTDEATDAWRALFQKVQESMISENYNNLEGEENDDDKDKEDDAQFSQ